MTCISHRILQGLPGPPASSIDNLCTHTAYQSRVDGQSCCRSVATDSEGVHSDEHACPRSDLSTWPYLPSLCFLRVPMSVLRWYFSWQRQRSHTRIQFCVHETSFAISCPCLGRPACFGRGVKRGFRTPPPPNSLDSAVSCLHCTRSLA